MEFIVIETIDQPTNPPGRTLGVQLIHNTDDVTVIYEKEHDHWVIKICWADKSDVRAYFISDEGVQAVLNHPKVRLHTLF